MSRVVLFLNGHIPDLEQVRSLILPGDMLLAADGGTQHILALGLMPSMVIGDLDSLSVVDLQKLENAGVAIRRFPQNKDETDFELALQHVLESGVDRILVVAALGNRLDQTLGNLALLAAPRFSKFDIRFDDGLEEVMFTRGYGQVRGKIGDIVSLIPWGGEANIITTNGLRWPLQNEVLFPYSSRGISNELLNETASVLLGSGLLLIVHRRHLRA
jgi:thiamine pyrophosphokinase